MHSAHLIAGRISVNLSLGGQRVAFWSLSGLFEVAHTDKKTSEGYPQYPKGSTKCLFAIFNWTDAEVETTYEQSLNQSPHNYCRTGRNSGRDHHSDCYNIIDGSFERIFSLTIGLHRIPLRSIFASENHRHFLYSLLPAERQRLKDTIQLEYGHIERIMTRGHLDTTTLRTEYEIAVSLAQLVAPIHRLPVELLALIFSLIPEGQNHKIDTLVRTCRRWKEIVSFIWAPLTLATWTSLDDVKATLEGSSGLISITIDPAGDTADDPTGSVKAERYAGLMLAISTSMSRWRTLDILSLPDPHQTNEFFGEQSQPIHTTPMGHLKSLSIPTHHDSSQLLDLLLPSIGATASDQLTDMHLCSEQAVLYLAQPHCSHVFNYLTSFKCFLPRTDNVFDILPQFWRLEILDLSDLGFPTYAPDVELPLTKTLRQMSIHGVPIGWMDHRKLPTVRIMHHRFTPCTGYNTKYDSSAVHGILL